MKKETIPLLLLLSGSILLNLPYLPGFDLNFDDKEIFRYIGMVIYKGGVPYRDVFDHKPPLIYFFNALYGNGHSLLPWLLDTSLVLLATGMFYALCKKKNLFLPWALPLLFNLLIRYSLVSFGNGMTREYTAIFLLLFFCVMMRNHRFKYFLLGCLTALTFWMQQDAILTLMPFLVFAIYSTGNGNASSGHRLLRLAAGILTITVPILVYFAVHHALADLWNYAFLFNFRHTPDHHGFLHEIKTIKRALHLSEFEMAFYTSFLLGVCALFFEKKKRGLLAMALATLILSFSGEWVSGRLSMSDEFIYYLLPLAAAIPAGLFIVFTQTEVFVLRDKSAQLVFMLLSGFVVMLGTLRFVVNSRFSAPAGWSDGIPEVRYLDTQRLTDYQLYVFDDSNLILLYNKYRIRSPTPWVYHFFWDWYADWDVDQSINRSIFSDLLRHRTGYILDCSGGRPYQQNKPFLREWQNFLNTHYVMIETDSSGRRLWRIQ